jgi:hypothetical protein
VYLVADVAGWGNMEGGRGQETQTIEHGCRKHCTKWCLGLGGDGGIEHWKHRFKIHRNVVLYTPTTAHCLISNSFIFMPPQLLIAQVNNPK